MPQLYRRAAAGGLEKVYVPDDQVSQALKSKKFGFPSGSKIPMVFPGGRVIQVSSNKVHKAYNLGLRLQTDEEAARGRLDMGETGTAVAAGAAGLARGASFGLTDLLLTETGMVEPDTLRDLRIAEQGISTGTEIGGAIAPMLLTKRLPGAAKLPTAKLSQFATSSGQRVANKVLGAVSKTDGENLVKKALRRGTEYGVGGAIEGTVYGAGQGLTEYALGNEDTIAGAVVAHMTPGGIIGGGLGAAIGMPAGAFSHGVNKATRAIGARMKGLPGTVQAETVTHSTQRVAKSLGMDQKNIKRLEKLGKLERGTDALGTPGLAADGRAIVDPKLGKVENAQRVMDAQEHWGSAIEGAYSQLDEAATVTGRARLDRDKLITKVDEWADKIADDATQADKYKVYKSFTARLGRGQGELSFVDAAGRKMRLGRAWRDAENARARGTVVERGAIEARKDLERLLDAEMKTQAKTVIRAGEVMEEMGQKLGNGRERFNKKALDNLLEANDNYSKIASYASALKHSGDEPLAGLVGQIAGAGARGLSFGLLWGAGPLRALVRGAGYAAIPLARGASKRMGPGVGSAMKHRQWAKLGKVNEMANKVQSRISKTTERVVSGRRPTYVAPAAVKLFGEGKRREEKAREYAEHIKTAIRDPNEFTKRIASSMAGLEEVAPNIAAKTAAQTAHIYNTLSKMVPEPKIYSMLQPQFDAQPSWNETELASFVRAATVAEEPLSVLDDLDAGRLNGHSVSMLRLLHPPLHAAISAQIKEELGKMDKPLVGKRRQQIAAFLGESSGATFTAGFLRRQKSVWEQAGSPQGEAPQGTSLKGLQASSDAAERASTQTQKLETV